jgi:hypothetical protein
MIEGLFEFKLKNPSDVARWEALLNSSSGADVYHRAPYILASSQLESSEPIGLMVSLAERQFMVPTLVRTVIGPTGQSWKDATSPYGYGGVFCEAVDVQPEIVGELFRRLQTWCVDQQLVCCVLRSHPLLEQQWLLDAQSQVNFVEVRRGNPTVAVNLQEWDEGRQCPARLSKGRRSDLAFSRRSLRVTWNLPGDSQSTIEQLDVFQKLYAATMLRLGADEFFRFPYSYYLRLSELGKDIGIAIAWLDERPVGAAIFMAGRTYAHYHLSATDQLGRENKAATLLVIAGAEWARERGCRTLHLGGGVGRNETLLNFKQSFGGSSHEYGYVELVADHSRYQAMCAIESPPWPYDQRLECRIRTFPVQRASVEMLLATNPADAKRWSTLVGTSEIPDVYYLPEYVRAASAIEHSEPVAIVAGSDACRILAPLLIRHMSAGANDSRVEWVDACSPYGYGGLLNLSSKEKVDARDLHCFLENLHNWCSEQHLVCCVLRLHPLMQQEEWFMPEEYWQKFLRIQFRGPTSAIDLRNWDAPLGRPRGLRRDRRADLNCARRTLRVTWQGVRDSDVEASLNLFIRLYSQRLNRLSADEFYRFPASYFSHLAALRWRLGIAFAWRDDELVGGNLFLAGWNYAHGHLASTSERGREYGASTLLLVEGSQWARQRGCELLHLGGGMSPGDPLEDYKRSFGGPSFRYAYVIYIADPERFEQFSRVQNAPWPYATNEPTSVSSAVCVESPIQTA